MKERLKELRKKLGLKQREVAERLEINTGTWGDFESGRAKLPRARIIQLCKEFNVRREWLEKGEGEMFEPEKGPREIKDILKEATFALFNELSPVGQQAVLEALNDRIKNESKENKTQINNGRIEGDMIQN